MSAVVLAALAACVVPVDQSAGWKLVKLSPGALALRAEGDLDQLRGGERLTVLDRRPSLIVGGDTSRAGSTRYDVRLPRGATRVRLAFARALQSAQVDVVAVGAQTDFPLLQRRRVPGRRVEVTLPRSSVGLLRVVVHHHLRPRPLLDQAEVEWQAPASGAELPGAVPPGWLAYRHPGGRLVRLCDAPGVPLRLELENDAPWDLPPLEE